MKTIRQALALTLIFALMTPAEAAIWYVRADGGTRVSSNQPNGQCDGTADVAYSPSLGSKHCAFGDVRWLWQDGSYTTGAAFPGWGWIGAGGDTYIIHKKTDGYRIGWNNASGTYDAPTQLFYGIAGDPYASGAPSPPSGTAGAYTKIIGDSGMTSLFGGYGVSAALSLASSYVDVSNLEITRHSQCIKFGVPAYPAVCNTSVPGIDDYDGSGIATSAATHDVLLSDMWIHGHTSRGIIGPIGANVTCLRCTISYNGAAGWDFDDGRLVNGQPAASPYGPNASWSLLYSTVEWNGCNQEYPITHTFPAISCYSQSSGGYGDGVGTPTGTGTGMSVTIDHSVFRYNTQDGPDLLHIDAGSNNLSITNSSSYSNGGSQYKWGGNFANVTFSSNLAFSNCLRMSAPIAGSPSTFNTNLKDFCRAQDAIVLGFNPGSTATVKGNTIVSYSPTTLDVQCNLPQIAKDNAAPCPNATLNFSQNIVFGYDNPATYTLGGKPGGVGGFYTAPSTSPALVQITRSANIWYGSSKFNVLSNEFGEDPQLTNEPAFTTEASLDSFDATPTPGSRAATAGIGAIQIANTAPATPPATTPTTPVTTPPATTPAPAAPPSMTCSFTVTQGQPPVFNPCTIP